MKTFIYVIIAILIFLLLINSINGQSEPSNGILTVKINNIQNENGKIIVKLFRKGDDLFGKPFLQLSQSITDGSANVKFNNLPYASYVAFAFHDENGNGIIDHNWIGIPAEPYGYSNNWNFNLLSGMPTYEKTKFLFSKEKTLINIKVE